MKFAALTTLLAKLEVTPGVDSVPVVATNAILGFNVKLEPMAGSEATRKAFRHFFTAAQKFPTNLYQVLTFETELTGHAVRGTKPGWSALAEAVGLAEVVTAATSVVYTPISTAIKSASIYVNFDGILHKMTHARGDCAIKLSRHGIPMMQWRFFGLLIDPADVAIVAPVLSSFQEPQVANFTNTPTFTVNGYAAVMSDFELNFNNSLIYREKVNARSVEINDREPSMNATVEVETIAAFNPHALAKAQTQFAVNLVHGVGSGDIVTIAATNCRMGRPSYGEDEKLMTYPLDITPLPTAGNDDFSITLT